MTRKKKLMFNSATSLIYQCVVIICGFVLPKFFMTYYGSAVNGLVSSITQFLGFISLADCGVGAVVKSTLYKPLAEHDMDAVSRIVISANRFFRRIAYLLLAYTAVLVVVYPVITIDSFDYLFTAVLILVISISTFAQYYLGVTYKLLLEADQLGFLQYSIHAGALILNTVVSILLMTHGVSVQIVKLSTSLIFLIQPILLSAIAKRMYKIDHTLVLTEEPIKQKWNGLAQHIASVVLVNTDTIVLTLLSTLENVSIYAVYNMIAGGVKQVVVSMTNGMQAMLGNMLAKNEKETLDRTFDNLEWLLHTLVTLAFSVTALLIVPFVQVYTSEITDADYIVPAFGYLITLAHAAYCFRLPYNIMVLAAGHYKQTQASAIIEAAINVVVSVVLVYRFGLVGVAVGTFAAMVFRTVYLAIYLSKNILCRKIQHFCKHLLADGAVVALLFGVVKLLPGFFTLQAENYFAWLILAVKVGMAALLVCVLVNGIAYREKFKTGLALLRKRK